MDGSLLVIGARGASSQCTDGLRLRQRLLKLRWMGLDEEADQLADEIENITCGLPRPLPRRVPPTD